MISDNGLRPNRFPEILANYNSNSLNEFGNTIDTSYTSLIGCFNNIMALGETRLTELSQVCYDSSNIMAAEGILLENLALVSGFTRNPASASRGVVYITGRDGLIIPESTQIESILGHQFEVEAETVLSSTYCVGCKIGINTLRQGAGYTLEVGEIGLTNTYRSDSLGINTKQDILEDLLNQIVADEELVDSFLDFEGGEPFIVVVKRNTGQFMTIQGSTFFTFSDIIVTTTVNAVSTGDIPNNAFSISTTLPNGAFVENRDDFVIGRQRETDEQLRSRILSTFNNQSSGSSYVSMERAIMSVPDVSYVKVSENSTYEPMGLPSKLPPKSFQVIVENGNPQLIAEAIWANKPAGILNYCDITNPLTQTVEVLDFNSQPHIVRFLRPSSLFIWIHAEYNLYTEEPFLPSSELIMREAMAAYGASLGLGKDILPDRFYSSVYTSVSGVNDLVIYMASTSSINTIPVFPNDYSQLPIRVTDEQLTNFSAFGTPARTTVRGWGTNPIPANPPTYVHI